LSIVDRLKWILELDSSGLNASAKAADGTVNKLATSIGSKLTAALKGAAVSYLGWRGLNIAKDLFLEAAAAEKLSKSFDNIAASMGLSSASIMADLRKMSNNTVSDVNLIMTASRAAIMKLPMETLPKLMEIAKAASEVSGQTAESMFTSIVEGIARSQPRLLHALGIIIDETSLYKDEVKKLGRELSEGEKQQYLLNEALRQGQSIISLVGETSDDASEKVEQLGAAWANFRVELGKTLTKEGGGISGFLADLLEGAKTYLEVQRLIHSTAEDFQGPMVQADLHIQSYNENLKKITQLNDEWLAFVRKLEDAESAMFGSFQRNIRKSNEGIREQIDLIKSLGGYLEKAYAPGGSRGLLSTGNVTQLLPGYGGPPEYVVSDWQKFWEDIEYYVGDAGTSALQGAFDAITGSLNEDIQKMIHTITSALKGDWYAVAADFVSSFIEIFTGGSGISSAEQLRDAQSELNDEYQRQLDLIERLTVSEREQRLLELQNAREELGSANTLAEALNILRGLGVEVPNMATWTLEQITNWVDAAMQGIIDEINALQGIQIDENTLRGIQSFQDLFDYLTNAEDIGYQEGRSLISHFAEMFDLTAEQQITLYEMLQDILEQTGNYTTEQMWALEEIIRGLEGAAEVIGEGSPFMETDRPGISDQIYRSITTITQTQANTMQAILNSIHYDTSQLVEIASALAQRLSGGYAGAGGGKVIIQGGINISSGGNANQMATAFVNELRAYGVKVA